MTPRLVPVSVVVMTFNEEVNLERCLEGIKDWASDVFVVDSYSTDKTLDIARRYTNQIYQHAYQGHPQQWQWALETLPFVHEWVFAVDADFLVTEELWDELASRLARDEPGIAGYFVRHRQIFRGRFIRHGTMYPRYWLRVFRRGSVQIDSGDLVDIHFYVDGGTARIERDVVEENVKERDIDFWVAKQLRFARRQAVEEIGREGSPQLVPVEPRLFGAPDQRILWLKDRWYGLPLYIRPFILFVYRYVLRLGFLDGKEGFLYHFTQALLYRLLVDVRIEELRRQFDDSGGSGVVNEPRRGDESSIVIAAEQSKG